MSRSGYSDDIEPWQMICWRGAVTSAIKGKRGQKLLQDMAAALDAMPTKRLIREEFNRDGDVCALGCLGKAKALDMSGLDTEDSDQVAETFGIAPAMAREIVYVNDEHAYAETPERRWQIVRDWVTSNLIPKK